jgi:hypothetical protein
MKILALKTTAMYSESTFFTEMHTDAATILRHSAVTQELIEVTRMRP